MFIENMFNRQKSIACLSINTKTLTIETSKSTVGNSMKCAILGLYPTNMCRNLEKSKV